MQEIYDSNIHGILQMPALTNFYAFAESVDTLGGDDHSVPYLEACVSLLEINRSMHDFRFNEFVKPVSLVPDKESNTRLAFLTFVMPFILDMVKTKANLNGVRSVSRGLGSQYFNYNATLDPKMSKAISDKMIEALNQQNITYCAEGMIETLEKWFEHIAKMHFVSSAQRALIESPDFVNNQAVRGVLRNVLGLIPKTLEFGTLKPCVENCGRITEDLLGFTEMIAESTKDTGVLVVYEESVKMLNTLLTFTQEHPEASPEAVVLKIFNSCLPKN